MEHILNYIKPELIVLIPVLYFVGMALKKSAAIKDNYIPLILGGVGIILSSLYVVGIDGVSALALFTAITQGILVAGSSVYINQIYKQGGGEN